MKELFNNIYYGKNVLVTGHTGFKGSWLCIWLKELGANVIGYSLDPYSEKDNFVASGLKDKIIDIRGDIRDFNKLQETFHRYNPEFVFHLAAQPLVRLSYEIPKDTYEINVMGTLNMLECIRNTPSVRVGIMITTDKCYENKEQIWGYRESDAMGGYDPYSSSKGCAEILIGSYRSSFMNPQNYASHKKAVASVRAGNVIGGGDWSKDRIVPDCIRALRGNLPIEIRSPHSIRPWQHVLEPLSGYLLLGSKLYDNAKKYSGGWNFGPDYDSIIPVDKVTEIIVQLWGKGQWIDLSDKNNNDLHEAKVLALDCTKAKSYLGWKPLLNITEALEFTVDWYKNYIDNEMYSKCKEQIEKYSKLMFEKLF